jgi:hypothetical protein
VTDRPYLSRRLFFVTGVVAGLAALTGAASTGMASSDTAATITPAPAEALASLPSPAPTATAPTTTAPTATAPTATASPPGPMPSAPPARSSVRLSVQPLAGGEPVRLIAPNVDLSLPVVPVSVGADGQLAVPEDVGTVGWWAGGGRPGAGSGPVVLTAHRDSRIDGRGPFADVERLGRGDTATLALRGGGDTDYRVVERRVYRKADLAGLGLFARDGGERLLLITCGGSYRRGAGGWDSNVVVTLRPV